MAISADAVARPAYLKLSGLFKHPFNRPLNTRLNAWLTGPSEASTMALNGTGDSMSTDEQWLTYRQAGALLHMSPEAARQRARRLRWRTQRGNDGKALVLVPHDEAERAAVQTPVQLAVQPAAQPPVQTGESEVLSTLVNTLRDELERVQAIAADDREMFNAERARLAAELHEERGHQRDQNAAQAAQHAADVEWHRGEIDRLQRRLDELAGRTWWQRLFRRS